MVAPLSKQSGVDILNRVFQHSKPCFDVNTADSLMSLRFPAKDLKRMQVLAGKAQRGTLSNKEHAEAEQYNLISHLLALLQAKTQVGKQSGSTKT